MNICVFGGSSNSVGAEYIEAGILFGRVLAEKGHGLVFGGGAGGLMGAAARGAYSAQGKITGVAPSFFNVDGVLFKECTEFVFTETMRQRKQKMEEMSEAFVMLPGGIGTLDEFFEIFTLKQLGRHGKPVGILNTGGYYDGLLAMLDKIVSEGFMLSECRDILAVSDLPEELIRKLEAEHEQNVPAAMHKNIQGMTGSR